MPSKMSSFERCLLAGYDDVVLFDGYSYDDALVGISEDGRAIYDYEKMIAWLVDTQGMDADGAAEWIEYNTIGSLPCAGPAGPIIMYPLE